MGISRSLTRVVLVAYTLVRFTAVAHAQELDLAQYRGKVVYLDFWASWCGPCKQSFPWLDRLQAEYRNKGLVVVAVNLDKDHRLAERFLQDHPSNLQVIFDPQGALASRYQLKAMPTSLVIGRDGQVSAVHEGFREHDEDKYLAHVAAALNRSTSQVGENK